MNNMNNTKNAQIIILIAITILIIERCGYSNQEKNDKIPDSEIVLEKNLILDSVDDRIPDSEIILEKELPSGSLVGTWYYTLFTDSTLKYKKIYDFNNLLPAYSYELIFEKERTDSVYLKGYWGENFEKLKKVKPSAYIIEYDERRHDSIITMKQGDNLVIDYKKQEYDPDPKKIKWEDNLFYKKELKIEDIEKYFAKNIFSGTYIDIDRKKKVTFYDSLTVSGIDAAKSFHISMGRYEYYDHMDILLLKDQYHWKFSKDSLILIEAFPFEDNGGPAGFNLGKIKYRFVKKK
jgi:hypothetical protein